MRLKNKIAVGLKTQHCTDFTHVYIFVFSFLLSYLLSLSWQDCGLEFAGAASHRHFLKVWLDASNGGSQNGGIDRREESFPLVNINNTHFMDKNFYKGNDQNLGNFFGASSL